VVHHGFIPLSRPLILSKIIIFLDSEYEDEGFNIVEKVDNSSASSLATPDGEETLELVTDPNDFARGLFFQITQNGKLIYDQLDSATKDSTGNVVDGIGETLISVDRSVSNDFQVKCFKHGAIDK